MSALDPFIIPIGGSTGACHESTAAIDAATAWLISEPDPRGRAIVLELKSRFGLTTVEACQAIAESNRIREVAR